MKVFLVVVAVFFSTVCLGQTDTILLELKTYELPVTQDEELTYAGDASKVDWFASFPRETLPFISDTGFVTRMDTTFGACLFLSYLSDSKKNAWEVEPFFVNCTQIEPMMMVETFYEYYTYNQRTPIGRSYQKSWRPQSEYFRYKQAKYILPGRPEGVTPIQFFPRKFK